MTGLSQIQLNFSFEESRDQGSANPEYDPIKLQPTLSEDEKRPRSSDAEGLDLEFVLPD